MKCVKLDVLIQRVLSKPNMSIGSSSGGPAKPSPALPLQYLLFMHASIWSAASRAAAARHSKDRLLALHCLMLDVALPARQCKQPNSSFHYQREIFHCWQASEAMIAQSPIRPFNALKACNKGQASMGLVMRVCRRTKALWQGYSSDTGIICMQEGTMMEPWPSTWPPWATWRPPTSSANSWTPSASITSLPTWSSCMRR